METLDLTTLECPEPFMKTISKLMSMKNGILKVIFKDKKCNDMIIEAVTLLKYKILESSENNGIYTLVIEKTETKKEKGVSISKLGSC
ncbi:MAG: sulfurtransferase TusA family protein [Sulfolobaceae archaeon]